MPKDTLDTLTFFIYVGGYALGSAMITTASYYGTKALFHGIDTACKYYSSRKHIKSQNIENKNYPDYFSK